MAPRTGPWKLCLLHKAFLASPRPAWVPVPTCAPDSPGAVEWRPSGEGLELAAPDSQPGPPSLPLVSPSTVGLALTLLGLLQGSVRGGTLPCSGWARRRAVTPSAPGRKEKHQQMWTEASPRRRALLLCLTEWVCGEAGGLCSPVHPPARRAFLEHLVPRELSQVLAHTRR